MGVFFVVPEQGRSSLSRSQIVEYQELVCPIRIGSFSYYIFLNVV